MTGESLQCCPHTQPRTKIVWHKTPTYHLLPAANILISVLELRRPSYCLTTTLAGTITNSENVKMLKRNTKKAKKQFETCKKGFESELQMASARHCAAVLSPPACSHEHKTETLPITIEIFWYYCYNQCTTKPWFTNILPEQTCVTHYLENIPSKQLHTQTCIHTFSRL